MKKPGFTSDELCILEDGLVSLIHETEKDLYDPSQDPSETFVEETERYIVDAKELIRKLRSLRAAPPFGW